MFSGQVPFYEIRQDYSVIIPVMNGKRPDFPSGDLSQTRGLNTEVWNLIQACWAQDPTQRPIVKQIVERLRSLPHRLDDNRPLDDFHFPTQAVYGRDEHPFSTIVAVDQISPVPGPTAVEQVPLASALAAEQTSVMSASATVTQTPLIEQALLASTPAPPTQTLVDRASTTLEREPLVSTPSTAEKSLLSSIPTEQAPSASVLAIVEQAPLVSAPSTAEHAPLASALTIGQTSPASGPASTEQTHLVSVPAMTEQAPCISEAFNAGSIFNVVIFGEAGAGKSSVVNMIAGRQVVQPSINAAGHPSRTEPHVVNLGGTPIKLWVTAGLNEEDNGTPNAKHTIINLYKLVKRLEDGISLLVYCVRGPGIKNSITRNYRLFHHGLCQQKVPIVLVVTGLEGENPMDAWWSTNQAVFEKQQLAFSGQACVTATKGQFKAGAYAFEKEYEESRKKVQKLIGDCSRPVERTVKPSHWVMETFKSTFNIVTRMLHVPLVGLNFSLREILTEYGGFSEEQARKIVYEVEVGNTVDDEERKLWSDIYEWVQS
jgi:50S ribosome-binding GTPase